ncbi:hypothetical protein K431DRAFT_241208 [Polychaeton citri CBS 116435]|uniref:MIT domain-containing protein n=1 Tax=Polychaeton citri CBS 116435 TaxID=1314669 RepID=A0A9P4UQ81_9PEZI|nr:hypothetical protein K431DRAFT_241208 [Polychaeton citri CBS 116435]
MTSHGAGKGGPLGTQAPSDTSLLALRINSNGQAFSRGDNHRRRKSAAVDYADYGTGEGLGNLNRWSQSTNSSVASNTRRNRASSGAVLPSLMHQQPPSSRQTRTTRERDPHKGHQRTDTRQKSLTALPPLHTTQSNTDTNETDSPSTNQTDTPATSHVPTPSAHSIYENPDYFVMREQLSPRSHAKALRPAVSRLQTAPTGEMQRPTRSAAEDAHHVRKSSRHSTQLDSGSRPTTAVHESGHRRPKTRERSEKDKKAMLSKALQKANTAVLLDNASNYEGALEAYADACKLLQMVMDRSSGPDDKRKLEAIRVTYGNRIEELRQLGESQTHLEAEEKGLPARPMSEDSLASPTTSEQERPSTQESEYSQDSQPATRDENTLIPQISYEQHEQDEDSFFNRTLAAVEDSSRQDFDVQHTYDNVLHSKDLDEEDKDDHDASRDDYPRLQHILLPPPHQQSYMPAPLSPRRLPPDPPPQQAPEVQYDVTNHERESETQPGAEQERLSDPESRHVEHAPISWLDTLDESASSCSESESLHSQDAATGIRRKHLRQISEGSNPDFDAAFDAAVEAAYNEGYEPDLNGRGKRLTAIHERHATGESLGVEEVTSPSDHIDASHNRTSDMEDEEEERLLDEITQDYAQGFNFDLGTKSALPRQSDSSSYTRSTRSTWQSSQPSDRNTAATSLSTVGEESLSAHLSRKPVGAPTSSVHAVIPETMPSLESLPPALPPPTSALPRPPSLRERRTSVASTGGGEKRASTVRARRLSGHAPKPLTIETTKPQSRKRASTFHNHKTSPSFLEDQQKGGTDADAKTVDSTPLVPTISDVHHEHVLQSPPSLHLHSQSSMLSIPNTITTLDTTTGTMDADDMPSDLPSARPSFFRKNKSSVSLREQHLVLSSPEDSQPSAVTPLSSTFMTFGIGRKQSNDPLTSQRAHFQPWNSSSVALSMHHPSGGFLFDTSLSNDMPKSPMLPRSPGPNNVPTGLEPCPESFLLRPFWLLRTVCQTLVHPRGGFITTQLFVPREVWQTQGVKLKATDEKIANCDLLTAALGRLAGVDSYDADALAEELHSFEGVMERVQGVLVKKLGSEVGVSSVQGMFKDAAAAAAAHTAMNPSDDASSATTVTQSGEKTNSKGKEGKSFSWRKLRSKSSGAPTSVPHTHSAPAVPGSGAAGTAAAASAANANKLHRDQQLPPNLSSVPMTSFVPVERRGGKRDIRNLNFEGPHREYMSSLARLLEGAQVLDQIARQVEDPGLKHSSPTHVGLELSIRHAAEFFGFYVCRFVLNDLGVLLDKFVKRGSEWVVT